jgi:aryl-alcohol dehydrogenase-like predicted oxidoreductase
MIKYCNFAGIGIIPYAVLNFGRLARPRGETTQRADMWLRGPLKEAEEEIVRRVEELAAKRGWLMSQVALAWIGTKVTSPLVGVSSVS